MIETSKSTAPRQDPIPLALKPAKGGDFALPPITIQPIISKFGLKNNNKVGFQELHMSDDEQGDPAEDEADQIQRNERKQTSSMSAPYKSIDKENKK